jgi:hypothetical protein
LACARDLLGRKSQADAEEICSSQQARDLPVDHAGSTWRSPKGNSAQVSDGQQPHLLCRQDSIHAQVTVQAYRIYHAKNGSKDKDGITFRQIKSDLRPGDHIDLFPLLKNLYLDQLAIGGGEGTDVLSRIKRAARGLGR